MSLALRKTHLQTRPFSDIGKAGTEPEAREGVRGREPQSGFEPRRRPFFTPAPTSTLLPPTSPACPRALSRHPRPTSPCVASPLQGALCPEGPFHPPRTQCVLFLEKAVSGPPVPGPPSGSRASQMGRLPATLKVKPRRWVTRKEERKPGLPAGPPSRATGDVDGRSGLCTCPTSCPSAPTRRSDLLCQGPVTWSQLPIWEKTTDCI